VFRLTPPVLPAKKWTYTVLHGFKGLPSDGENPIAGLIFDYAGGSLYGTTAEGGVPPKVNYGTVYKLSPCL
jgi:uncharacterized repeat protein (TIGR03803 family)